jgi:hypothetical protein
MSPVDDEVRNECTTQGPLKIGLLLDSKVNEAWVFSIIEMIVGAEYCNLSLVILNGAPSPSLSFKQKMRLRLKQGLFIRYSRWDYRRYRRVPDAFEEKDCAPLFARAEVRTVVPIQKGFTDRFPDADVEFVRSLGLDVLIRFGFRIIKGDILKAARYGVWSYHHGDNDEYRGGPFLFWEIYERNPVSGCILQVLNENLDAGEVLYKSWSATQKDSLYLNRNQLFWKSTQFVPRCLRALHEGGWARLRELANHGESGAYSKPIYKTPKPAQMLSFLSRRAGMVVRNRVNSLLRSGERPQWFVAYRRLQDNAPWRLIIAPEDRFFADPFLMETSGRTLLFFEDYHHTNDKGVISYVELLEDGTATEPKLALERDYHLSYPFLFEHEGTRYMIPESMGSNRIELYRAVTVPDRWELERVLVDNIRAADSTLVKYGGLHWLFCDVPPEGGASCDELYVFYSESGPLGPWRPHARNPVISDVRRSRPAGAFLFENNQLVRPSQDCSTRYGFAINLSRVDRLTTTEFSETLLRKITPDWLTSRNLATHTLNRSESYEVRDGKMYLSDLRRLERSRMHTVPTAFARLLRLKSIN